MFEVDNKTTWLHVRLTEKERKQLELQMKNIGYRSKSKYARAKILDDAVISGELRHAAEARLQMAKFGIAPDDLARLRIQFAQADEVEEKRRSSRAGADVRGRYKGLKAVDNA